MLKLGTARRTIAMAAATLAVAGGTIIDVGGVAHAAPASCTIIDIGAPGNIYVGGEYAGQVEQQYDSCGSARAHFQYSYSYWVNHRNDPLPSNWSANPASGRKGSPTLRATTPRRSSARRTSPPAGFRSTTPSPTPGRRRSISPRLRRGLRLVARLCQWRELGQQRRGPVLMAFSEMTGEQPAACG